VTELMLDVLEPAGEQIVEHEHVVSVGDQTIDEM